MCPLPDPLTKSCVKSLGGVLLLQNETLQEAPQTGLPQDPRAPTPPSTQRPTGAGISENGSVKQVDVGKGKSIILTI